MGRLKKGKGLKLCSYLHNSLGGADVQLCSGCCTYIPTRLQCLMSSPLEVDIEVLLYIHRNQRLIRDGSPGRPPRLSHSSWALITSLQMCRLSVILQDHSSVFQTRCAQPYFKIQHVLFSHFTFIFLESLCDVCEQSFYGSIPRACNYIPMVPLSCECTGVQYVHAPFTHGRGWVVCVHAWTHTHNQPNNQGYKWRSRIKCDWKYLMVLHTHTHPHTHSNKQTHNVYQQNTTFPFKTSLFSFQNLTRVVHVTYVQI